ncbi:MAG: immune inhibitor A domain-containing protein [bacterium]
MKRIFSTLCTIVFFFWLSCVPLWPCTTKALADERARSGQAFMPPNEASIILTLRSKGIIPEGSTEVEAKEIYIHYMMGKMGRGPEDKPHSLGLKHLMRGEKSGTIKCRHGHQQSPGEAKVDHILVLLVEFAGKDGSHTGPLHNGLPKPDRQYNTIDFWVEDFNKEHYEGMLFDTAPGALSMANYYLEQSNGIYIVDGQAYGWIPLGHSEWYYGADDAKGGIDNLNGPVFRLVRDAVVAAGNSIPWADYDTEDPYDLDGDGLYEEPDGYIDHLMVIHAGAGQEAGGGEQGDDAIWSHSWWVDYGTHGPGFGGIPTSHPGVWVSAYTVEPEDGTIGVFCHEFAHDLGLPDEYDTSFSGQASTGFWSLMSSGAWLGLSGKPLGTCPAHLSIWAKYTLGWVDPVTVNPGERKENILLRPVEKQGSPTTKAFKVNLPDLLYSFEVNEPHSGNREWYSGKGNELNHTLTRVFHLPGQAALHFWTWYDIEEDWDFGYIEISQDNEKTWQTLGGNITRPADPDSQNPDYHLTGKSRGWIRASFDLASYSGLVSLRFRYWTDSGVQGAGWTVDDFEIVDGAGKTVFFDDMESGPGDWIASGWHLFSGSGSGRASRYYLAEWRLPFGFDASMDSWHNVTDTTSPYKLVEGISANSGMLLWYRNGEFDDNWVGLHPWAGFLLVVDAHPKLVLADNTTWLANWLFAPRFPNLLFPFPNMDLPLSTQLQIVDAPFGLKKTRGDEVTAWFGIPISSRIPVLPAVSLFDDAAPYTDAIWAPWFESEPYGAYIRSSISSADTPTYGLKIKVMKESPCLGALVTVDFTGFSP